MPRSTEGLWESLGLLSGVLQHSEPVLEGSLCKIKISRDGIYLNLLLAHFLEENTGPYSVGTETKVFYRDKYSSRKDEPVHVEYR